MSAADVTSALVRGVCWLVLAGGAVLIPMGLWVLGKILLNTKQP